MEFEKLRCEVCEANKALVRTGLVTLTWGNASGADRQAGVFAIKPSGVAYDRLEPADMVILSLKTGEVVEGRLRPSTDTPSHLLLYQGFETIGGVVHTHSLYATAWAQAYREIPCVGSSHADHFSGAVPLTRQLSPKEVQKDYERSIGKVILEHFSESSTSPAVMFAALVPGHGPFVWGPDVGTALDNAVALEEVARMAYLTVMLNHEIRGIPEALINKHFLRKHGPSAYYGQKA